MNTIETILVAPKSELAWILGLHCIRWNAFIIWAKRQALNRIFFQPSTTYIIHWLAVAVVLAQPAKFNNLAQINLRVH